ncbi:MAG: hypothetical protein CVV30_04925 [Methanomicrobiales archaeon HGW-Methanomicrobiales-1]|jgi:hypothetical protein|nr:MAG: hypothetical protein CVV30_04925 [Methanomicrobiales archaeon HGW-Methanomicrobiales-1]
MNKFHWITIFYAVLLFSCCIQIVHATPPPPEGRSFYLLPNPTGPYYNQSIDLGFDVSSTYYDNGISSPFPHLTEYRGFRNFSFRKTGKAYISEVWYFNDRSTFKTNKDDLFQYLKKHGTLSPIVLNITEELTRTNDPWIARLRAKQINATKYVANDTSGYFILFSTDYFPGENYYIAYYGVVGRSDLADDIPQIKTLIMSCFPGFVETQKYTFDPTTSTNQPAPLPALLPILAIACIIFIAAIRKQKKE